MELHGAGGDLPGPWGDRRDSAGEVGQPRAFISSAPSNLGTVHALAADWLLGQILRSSIAFHNSCGKVSSRWHRPRSSCTIGMIGVIFIDQRIANTSSGTSLSLQHHAWCSTDTMRPSSMRCRTRSTGSHTSTTQDLTSSEQSTHPTQSVLS